MNEVKTRVTRLLQGFFSWFDGLFGRRPAEHASSQAEILCDTCKYNYGNACMQPERPNATACREYKAQNR